MIALQIGFPAGGRWHATSWGNHVNEGIPDWPPAPWRLLRALIATWYLKDAGAMIPESTLGSLIEKLAGQLPSYDLPPTSGGHTRHYMPDYKDKRAKVFDTFLHVASEESIFVSWDCEFEDDERQALAHLAGMLNYLGRAESLVEAKLVEPPERSNCVPMAAGEESDNSARVLAASNPEEYLAWRDEQPAKIRKELPATLFEALQADTGALQKAGWSQPPGSRWVYFSLPEQRGSSNAAARERRQPDKSMTVARFALVSNVSPSVTQALSVCERVHQALAKISSGDSDITGKVGDNPLKENHQHAVVIPESNNHRGTLDYLTVFIRKGFSQDAREALEKIRRVWGYGGHDVQLVLLGLGKEGDFAGTNSIAGHCLPLGKSRTWISFTPFVPTRHPKSTRAGIAKLDESGIQIGSPQHDLIRLLELEHGEGSVAGVEKIDRCRAGDREIPPLKYQRTRKTGKGHSAGNKGYAFRVRFREEVSGPVVVGYAAHFGLGVFLPERESSIS